MGLIGSILVLAFLVFFHELGHFLAAKFFGVKVEAFSIGFGSQKLWKKQIGETEYSNKSARQNTPCDLFHLAVLFSSKDKAI